MAQRAQGSENGPFSAFQQPQNKNPLPSPKGHRERFLINRLMSLFLVYIANRLATVRPKCGTVGPFQMIDWYTALDFCGSDSIEENNVEYDRSKCRYRFVLVSILICLHLQGNGVPGEMATSKWPKSSRPGNSSSNAILRAVMDSKHS